VPVPVGPTRTRAVWTAAEMAAGVVSAIVVTFLADLVGDGAGDPDVLPVAGSAIAMKRSLG
jgi:hypothetical protein